METKTIAFDFQMKIASILSIIVSVVLLIVKMVAFRLTDSQAIYSDAMESIINVVTAMVAFGVLYYAAKPADRDHPYGHGKVEYLSAGLEGGLITFAAIVIFAQAIEAFYKGNVLHALDVGLLLVAIAGAVNFFLGVFLLQVGKKKSSTALEASGRHLLADFWTSAGVIGGLMVVWITKVYWLDALIAVVVSLHLAREGFVLVRKAIGGLLDEEEEETINNLRDIIDKNPKEGIIQVHHVRVMRSGRFHHIDAHVVVPEYWSVEEAHDQTLEYERILFKEYEFSGEFHFHIDPCRRLYCQFCDVKDCKVRKEPFKERRQISVRELTDTDEPKELTENLKDNQNTES